MSSIRPTAIGYLRVSTDRQADEGFGLAVQEEAIKAWARSSGHRLVGVFSDEGVSGSLLDRPGLADALDAIKAGQASALVVYRLDRLARDLIVQEQLLAEARRLGGQVASTAASEAHYLADDPDDPSRRLIRQVLGAVAEYERAMTVLRLRTGRRHKARSGGFAYGSPPLGWKAQNGALARCEEEQAALALIRRLRLSGASLRDIGAALAAEGHATKRGGRWHPTTIAAACRRMGIEEAR